MAAKKITPGLAQRVLDNIPEHRLIFPQKPLVVAVSGGADSVCLLHVLHELRDELGVSLHVAHLNHSLRGAEGDADAAYVAKLAGKLGLPSTNEKRNVKAYQSSHKMTLEEAAREVRYNFLAEVAESVGAERVAVGHTRNDHIETILMHLIRGTGTRGLRGLQPEVNLAAGSRKLTVVRPLLTVTREETEKYCLARKLKPRVDSTNFSLAALRNKIRLELLPVLKGYNAGVEDALLRTARTAADELSFLDEQVDKIWEQLACVQQETVSLDKAGLLKLHPALQRHLLRAAIEKLAGELRDIEVRHIEEIMGALGKPAGKRLNLPDGLVFATDYDRFLLAKGEATLYPAAQFSGEYPLQVPGATTIPGWMVKASVLSLDEAGEKAVGDFIACMDMARAGSNLKVRGIKPGDRFQPLGMKATKTVAEFMLDAKIARARRNNIPLVCNDDGVIWVVGSRIDERVKITRQTRRVLRLEFQAH